MSAENWKKAETAAELKLGKRVDEFCALTENIQSLALKLHADMSPTRASVLAPEGTRVKQPWESEITADKITDRTYDLVQAYHAVNRAKRELERIRERTRSRETSAEKSA